MYHNSSLAMSISRIMFQIVKLLAIICTVAANPVTYIQSPVQQQQRLTPTAAPVQQQPQYRLVQQQAYQPQLYQTQAYEGSAQPVAQPQYVLRPAQQLAGRQPQQLEAQPEDYDPNPQYQFSFDVKDDEFTNYQNRKENRDGDKITGSYSVVDSDGFIRTVKYTADPLQGFKAEVTREPTDIVVKLPTPVQSQQVGPQQQAPQQFTQRQQATQQYLQAAQPATAHVFSTLSQQSPQQLATLQALARPLPQRNQVASPQIQQYTVQPQYVAIASPKPKAKIAPVQYTQQAAVDEYQDYQQ